MHTHTHTHGEPVSEIMMELIIHFGKGQVHQTARLLRVLTISRLTVDGVAHSALGYTPQSLWYRLFADHCGKVSVCVSVCSRQMC